MNFVQLICKMQNKIPNPTQLVHRHTSALHCEMHGKKSQQKNQIKIDFSKINKKTTKCKVVVVRVCMQ